MEVKSFIKIDMTKCEGNETALVGQEKYLLISGRRIYYLVVQRILAYLNNKTDTSECSSLTQARCLHNRILRRFYTYYCNKRRQEQY